MKNKIFNSKGFLFLGTMIFAQSVSATVYIVPKEYDNVYNSIRSKSVAIIHNGLPANSANHQLAGKTVKYRCMSIDKIPCRGAIASVTVSVTDVVLLDDNDHLLPIYGYEVISEDRGTKWGICSAAAGGYSWDTSVLSSHKDGGGNTVLDYTYTPNTNNKNFLFFTNQANKGSSRSHMVIDVQQKCR